jgi:multiple sugar transport system ATP-binding protein
MLYDHPVNLFVAGFIGSPSMNFLPATVDGERVRSAFGEFELPPHMRGAAKGEVILGVRPEDFEDASIAGDKPGHVFETEVSMVESLGSDIYAYIDLEGQAAQSEQLAELAQDAGGGDLPGSDANQVTTRLSAASQIKQGGRAKLWLDTTKVHLFDPHGGDSLTVSRAREQATTGATA